MAVTMRMQVLDSVNPILAHAIRSMSDCKPPLRTAGAYLYRSFVRQFQAEGVPRWKPHATETYLRRVGGIGKLDKLLSEQKRLITGSLKPRKGETLAEAKARAKKRLERNMRRLSPKLLQDTGLLRRSYGRRGADSIYELTDFTLTIGSRVKYARIHQFGGWSGTGHRSKIPARPLTILDEDRKAIRCIFIDHATRSFKR